MNENAKRAALIVVTVIAVIVAGLSAFRFFRGDQPEVVRTIKLDPAHSMKRMEMAQQNQRSPSSTPPVDAERDLAGNLGPSNTPKGDR